MPPRRGLAAGQMQLRAIHNPYVSGISYASGDVRAEPIYPPGMARNRRVRGALAAATLVAVAAAPAAPAAARTGAAPGTVLPTSMAALGDSITRGFNACGFYRDCTSRSWSTGDSSAIDSHRLRLGELGAELAGEHNLARDGARAEGLAAQAERAAEVRAQYVTVQIGANDACRSSEARMTPVREFRAALDDAFDTLEEIEGVRVFVTSIPDVHRLWETLRTHRLARWTWDRFDICQSLLAKPNSTAKADVARRDRVRDRVKAYNKELRAACEELGDACRYDGGAVFEARFTGAEVSKWDWFHPSRDGQRRLAEVTWKAGFRW
jgi:lysophospholipase L1-like esterase